MAKLKEVLVVEGKDDTKRIAQAVEADTFETNGSAVNKAMLEQIKKLQATRGVIVLTDPDFNGERIRRLISDAVPDAKHAFITKKQGVPTNAGGSLGVEHADPTVIRTALTRLSGGASQYEPVIFQHDLLAARLVGQPESRKRREQLGVLLNLGYVNGKQLLKRLQLFQVSRADFDQAVAQLK
ncbi:ribonuclease M5 [Furfurilactobacillus siliginis]|uniref:Ribonuclease M5 n=1 Tax=Furfurilactobacillus siliginis TaxID=348151 RepID=A0A0R2L899_9LACO|nr:ribonuclease M5 [Furfurilactobacillus siliginis]KRN95990.1 primase-like protein [Furfurilactobacillus siliginis]GEK28845.1 ribonuclease M5 [Furfurilactobacillus siliginis]